MTQDTIPPRITKLPAWLYDKNKIDEEQITQDLISFAYWALVDARAEAMALSKVKKERGWIITLPLEKQTPEIGQVFKHYLADATEEFGRMLDNDVYVRARMLAEAVDNSFDTAEGLQEVMERVQVHIVKKLEEQGLLSFLEYDNITEYMLSKSTPWDGTGKPPGSHSEIAFMVEYLIPALEANGFPRKLLLSIAENFHKARYAIPYLRRVLSEIIEKAKEIKQAMQETSDVQEKELLKQSLYDVMKFDSRLHDLLEALIQEMSLTVKQGGVSANEFRAKMSRITRNAPETEKMLGYVYNMKEGGVLMISVNNVARLNALQRITDKLVDWHLGDPRDLAREAGKQLLYANQLDEIKKILHGIIDGNAT